MPPRVSATGPPEGSTRRAVAAGLAGMSAALLGVKAAVTLGAAPDDALGPLAGSFVALVAGAAFAAGVSAIRAPDLARVLLVVTLGGAVFGDFLIVDPAPRHLHLLPLAIATGLMFVAPATAAQHGRSSWATVSGWLGIALHAAVGWLYLVSGLVVPDYGVVFLWALWAILLVVALRLMRDRPSRTPVVPVVAAGAWLAIVHLGGVFLGWAV